MHYFKYISKDFVKQFLPENPVIVEAGANKGRDTLDFKKQWPAATIHAFEPVPTLFKKLCNVTKHEPSISCYNYALFDKTMHLPFYESDQHCDAISSSLKPHLITQQKPKVTFNDTFVNAITLDDWASKYNVKNVDLLWLDVQGAELLVLKGAMNLLANIKAIHLEVSTVERYANQPLYDEIKHFLTNHNFTLIAQALYRINWGNALFIKKS